MSGIEEGLGYLATTFLIVMLLRWLIARWTRKPPPTHLLPVPPERANGHREEATRPWRQDSRARRR